MQGQATATKACRICREFKPLTAFWAQKRSKDGRRSECAACSGAQRRRRWRLGPPDRGPRYVERDCGYESPCWIWQRALGKKGYGVSNLNGRWMQAHKVFYVERHGPVPKGLCLDHLCRVPRCVNPDHMEVVTYGENLRRGLRAKIAWADVADIRASEESHAALGRRYGISAQQISNIRNFKRWNTP